MQMITTHWVSHFYRKSDDAHPLNLAASPGALRYDHQVGEKKAFCSMAIAPRGGVNDRCLWLKPLAKEAFNVF
jgi:hypothetical protein